MAPQSVIVQKHSNKHISRRSCACVSVYMPGYFSQWAAMVCRADLKRLEAHAVGHKGGADESSPERSGAGC